MNVASQFRTGCLSGAQPARGTTVLCVRRDDQVVIMADGQVTQGNQVVKPNVRKVRRIGENAIGGFAGPAPVAVRAEEAVFISFHHTQL